MAAYYNEIDPYCVEWLRNLIREGLITDGQVDDRSISDVTPNDLRGFTQCHFFAGLGGWSGALRLAAWPDNREVWTGSCPCQPFSLAGRQGGFTDERHLWPHWHYLIQVCRPPTVLGEQVASASAWLRLVRGDLEALDYAVGAIPVEAASAGEGGDGGPYHLRDRFWFVGHSSSSSSTGLALGPVAAQQRGAVRQERPTVAAPGNRGNTMAHANGQRQPERTQQHGGAQQPGQQAPCWDDTLRCGLADANGSLGGRQAGHPESRAGAVEAAGRAKQSRGRDGNFEWVFGADGKARRVKSGIRLLAHGVPARVAKLRALGNAIDLRPAAAFIKAVM